MIKHQSAKQTESPNGNMGSYVIGLVLAFAAAIASCWVVMDVAISGPMPTSAILSLVLCQIVVHLGFFLNLNLSSEKECNLIVHAFMTIVVNVLVGGAAWFMYHRAGPTE